MNEFKLCVISGIPLADSKEIRDLAKSYNLKHDLRQLEGQPYMVMLVKMAPSNMAACLKEQGGSSGRFSVKIFMIDFGYFC